MTAGTLPVRFPDASNAALMTRRAWWLVGLNILIPGSVQVLAGSRRLGRFGLGATVAFWVLLLLSALLALLWRPALITISTNVVALTLVQAVAIFYAALWILLTVDALRLVRIVRIAPNARAAVAALALVALVVVAGTAAYGAGIASSARGLLLHSFAGGEMRPPADGRYNILLLGGDAGADRVGLRPDSISVVSIDDATGQIAMIGIPRNQMEVPFATGSPLYGPFPKGYDCGSDCLINALYTYGQDHPELYPGAVKADSTPGIEATKDAVEGVLGIPIQYYVLIDMQGFSDLVDALGGIELDSDGKYPIGGDIDRNGKPIHVGAWIYPGKQHMDGNTALWYARSRHGTDDFNRMGRQRQVEDAMLKQMSPQNVLTRFQAVTKAGGQVVRTDIPQGALPLFIDRAQKAKALPVQQLELVPDSGYHPGEPDYAKIHADVHALLFPPTASPAAAR